jgi:uncharacterized protein with PQ loop repeat
MNWIEGLGYIATVVTLLSMVVSDVKLLRGINGLGCLLWIGYGILTNSIPVLLVNTLILIIHIFKLIQMREEEENGN